MAERPGVVVYFEIEPALQLLNDAQRGRLFTGMLEYARYGVLPAFGDPLLEMAWNFVKPSIDRDAERYAKSCHQKKLAGYKSDFRRNYAPKHGLDPDDDAALQAYISQRLSTDADECQPIEIPTATATPTPAPTTNEIIIQNGTTDAKRGVGRGEQLSPEDFERNRQEQIARLLGQS